MSIADLLGPQTPAPIVGARIHLCEDEDMSKATDIADAIRAAGGKLALDEIKDATGMEGKALQNAIYNAKTQGLITHKGKDFIATGTSKAPKAGSTGTSKPPKAPKAAPPAKAAKAAKKARKPRLALAKIEVAQGIERADERRQLITRDTRAVRLLDGGAIVLQGGFAVAELTPIQFDALAQLAAHP